MIYTRTMGTFCLSVGLALSIGVLPALTGIGTVDTSFAKDGNGGGNGGGNSGGNSGGGSGGKGGGKSDHSGKGNASGKSKSNKAAQSKSEKRSTAKTANVVAVKEKNTLGPLNAAHASATARAHAAPNSAVGKLAAYEQSREAALAVDDPVERQALLDQARLDLEAAFGTTISPDELAQVDNLLDAEK